MVSQKVEDGKCCQNLLILYQYGPWLRRRTLRSRPGTLPPFQRASQTRAGWWCDCPHTWIKNIKFSRCWLSLRGKYEKEKCGAPFWHGCNAQNIKILQSKHQNFQYQNQNQNIKIKISNIKIWKIVAHPFGMAAMLRAPASSVTNFTVSLSVQMNYQRK